MSGVDFTVFAETLAEVRELRIGIIQVAPGGLKHIVVFDQVVADLDPEIEKLKLSEVRSKVVNIWHSQKYYI